MTSVQLSTGVRELGELQVQPLTEAINNAAARPAAPYCALTLPNAVPWEGLRLGGNNTQTPQVAPAVSTQLSLACVTLC